MIEAAREPVALADREIKLELIGAAPGRIGPRRIAHDRAVLAEIAAVPGCANPCDAVEQGGELGCGHRLSVVIVAHRVAALQELREGRNRTALRGLKLSEVDLLALPWRSH